MLHFFSLNTICAIILVLSTASLHAQAIGEVNGVAIDAAEFEVRASYAIDEEHEQNPEGRVDESAIREALWNQMVGEILIAQAAERIGIRITDEDFQRRFLYDPPEFLKKQFTDSTGIFDAALYRNYMSDVDGFLSQRQYPREQIEIYKQMVARIQKSIRIDDLRRAVDSAVTISAVPSPAEVLAVYRNQNSRATGSFAMLDANVIPDEQVTVTNDEAQHYFEAHRDEFTHVRSVGDHDAGLADTIDVTAEVMAAVRTQKKLDALDDRAMILRAALSPRDKLTKLTTLDKSVRIQEFKDLSPSSPFPGAGVDSALAASVFSQKTGEISPAVRGKHAYYIVQVKSRKVPTEKEFAAVRDDFTRQLTWQRRMAMFQEWFSREHQQANIQDYRTGRH